MLLYAKNPNNTNATLPYGNPSGRPPEESTPTVIASQYERPTSPTPLEGQCLAKKGKRDLLLVDNGSDDMDADGVMLLSDDQNGDDLAGSGDALKVGQSQLHPEIPTLGKATYASVVDKESTHSDTKKSGTKYVKEEVECEGLRNQTEEMRDSNSAAHHTSHSEGQDIKEIESFGPWMVAKTHRRRPAVRNAAIDNTRSLADLGTTKEHPSVGGSSNGVTKNTAYMASNLDKCSKAAAVQTRTAMVIPTVAGQSAKAVEHVTGGLKGSHTAVKIMEPTVKAGLKGNTLEGFHPPVLVSHSSDEETMYDMSDEEAMTEVEEVERLLAQ
ncbi:hypothetical protein V6N12_017762 [Hibiscus sabdariffa]|uniref:Uncharacterized protein n=1 Tax=Hibiscus sabdariffa TaxID=183260 RepID=A0ABR2A439_9ROSI